MRCWACAEAINLDDLVNELPIAGALVHKACYEWETGQPSHWAKPLRVHLTPVLTPLVKLRRAA
jgi:hypothetical protein